MTDPAAARAAHELVADAFVGKLRADWEQMKKTPSLGGGVDERKVFAEQDFVVEAPQTHVAYRPLTGLEIEPEAVRDFRNGHAFGTPLPEVDFYPGPTEPLAVCFAEPLGLEDHAADSHWLADQDEDRVREFWLVYAGHELYVWSLRLNELGARRAAHEQQQKGESDGAHLELLPGWPSALQLELSALERVEFYFGKFVDAAGEVHRQDFLDQLCALVDREEWKQGLRNLSRKRQELVSVPPGGRH